MAFADSDLRMAPIAEIEGFGGEKSPPASPQMKPHGHPYFVKWIASTA